MTPLIIAVILAVFCAGAAWQVWLIPESMLQMAVGPTLVPAVVVASLSVLVLLYGISAWRGRQVDDSQQPDHTALPGATRRLVSLLGGGVLFALLILPLGFVLPAALCGMGVARAFDAPLNTKSALICGAIASVFWLIFARLLGVNLGPALPFGF